MDLEVVRLRLELRGRMLLDDVSLKWPAMSLSGVMGMSGSGKSTLLKVVGDRCRIAGAKRSGDMVFGGVVVSRVKSAFVAQSDSSVCGSQTPREAARLRVELTSLGSSAAKQQKSQFADDILRSLDVTEAAMDTLCSKISGGELRRTSIALALASTFDTQNNAPPLLVDEGTSGLDAITALHVVKVLRRVARDRVVLCSIHVPSSQTFATIDTVSVLHRGQVVYQGPTSSLASYLATVLDVKVDHWYNPADAVIDCCAKDENKDLAATFYKVRADWETFKRKIIAEEEISKLKSPLAIEAFHNSSGTLRFSSSTEDEDGKNALYYFFPMFYALLKRECVMLSRDCVTSIGYLVQSLLMGLVVGYIFYDLSLSDPNDLLVARPGLLYLSSSNMSYISMVFSLFLYSKDARLFDRERDDKATSAPAHWCAYVGARLPLYAAATLCYYIPAYYLPGLQGNIFVYLGLGFAMQMCVFSMGLLFVGIARDFDIASLIGNSVFTFTSMSCGFLVNPSTFHVWDAWWRSISFNGYGFALMMRNEYADIPEGKVILKELNVLAYDGALAGMIIYPCLFFLLSLVAAQFIIHDPDADHVVAVAPSKKITKNNDLEEPLIDSYHVEIEEERTRGITVRLADLWLRTNEKNSKSVLRGATAIFPETGLSIILGPSGAGKSSILDAIAGRTSLQQTQGEILFDETSVGSVESRRPVALKNATAYVMQSFSLLPSLTVDETLHFSAALADVAVKDRDGVVDRWMNKLGLSRCGETLASRCSGGERRRVAVALQLLTSPPCCCLDEPTTGLDAAAAWRVLDVLATLSKDTCVISTLHSPRSDVYSLFSTVVLVTKGRVAWCGPATEAVEACEAMTCDPFPEHTNPSDYLLVCAMGLFENDDVFTPKEKSPVLEDASEGHRRKRVMKRSPPTWRAYLILVQRAFLNTVRQPTLLLARALQVVFFALIISYFFAPMRFDQASVGNRAGAMFEWCALMFIGMLNCMSVFPNERNVFLRENLDGAYGPLAFLASYTSIEMPFNGICGIVFSLLMTFAVGMRAGPYAIFVRAYAVTAVISVGESVAIAFCACFDHPGFALSLVNLNLAALNILSGFLSGRMPALIVAINQVNPLHYMATAIANLEFYDTLTFTCDQEKMPYYNANYTNYTTIPPDMTCIADGDEALKRYAYQSCGGCVGKLAMLAVYSLVYRFIAYLLLVLRTSR